MSDTTAAGPVFTAQGVVIVGGRQMAAEPVAFDLSGAHMILQQEPSGDGYGVIQAGRIEPGVARFEKTCMEPVFFLVTRDGEPYWKVEVKGMFDSMRLVLAPPA